RDRETETGPASLTSLSRIGAVELVEDLPELTGRDPDSGVGDADPKSSIDGPDTHCDRALIGVLDRVAEQIEQDLHDLLVIGDDPWQRRLRFEPELHARRLDERFQ